MKLLNHWSGVAILIAAGLLICGSRLIDGQINPDYCTTSIGGWQYDLTDLANLFNYSDATTMDSLQNIYFYRPCQPVLDSNCVPYYQQAPMAGCQRDTRRPPQYHDLGALNTTWFGMRDQGPDSGFIIYFWAGDAGRSFSVEFVCDPFAGQGYLYAVEPTESPQLVFHLAWNTSYACPLNNNTNNNTNNNSTGGIQCCLYDYSGDNEVTKTLCLDTSLGMAQCPSDLGKYEFIGQWPVDDCSDCFFNGGATSCDHGDEISESNDVSKATSPTMMILMHEWVGVNTLLRNL